MPVQYNIDSISPPKNPAVKLVEVPNREVAVVRFSGIFSHKRSKYIYEKLRQDLKSDGYKHREQFMIARYNPPWTPPFMTRHEVWIELIK